MVQQDNCKEKEGEEKKAINDNKPEVTGRLIYNIIFIFLVLLPTLLFVYFVFNGFVYSRGIMWGGIIFVAIFLIAMYILLPFMTSHHDPLYEKTKKLIIKWKNLRK